MKQNRSNILITGARGFIGRSLVEYLAKSQNDKYSLFYPYHSELDLLDTEATSKFITGNNIDIVIHCAKVGGSRKTYYDTGALDIVSQNLRMFFNIAHCLKQLKLLINLGTGAEYDMRHYRPRMSEDYFDTHVPADDYSFSKYVCSKYILNSEKIICLRLFAVFGKYEDYAYRFISNSIVRNLLGLPISINQNVYFDYTYIDDLVKIIEYFITHDSKHNFYNITTAKPVDLVTIAGMINQIADKPSEVIVKNPGLNFEYSGDNSRLLQELGGYDFTPLDKSLRELYLWHKDNLDKIDRQMIEKDEYFKYCRTKAENIDSYGS